MFDFQTSTFFLFCFVAPITYYVCDFAFANLSIKHIFRAVSQYGEKAEKASGTHVPHTADTGCQLLRHNQYIGSNVGLKVLHPLALWIQKVRFNRVSTASSVGWWSKFDIRRGIYYIAIKNRNAQILKANKKQWPDTHIKIALWEKITGKLLYNYSSDTQSTTGKYC